MRHRENSHHRGAHKSAYRKLMLMGLIHLPIMYAVMFTMVYSFSEIFHNLNTFYMAGMMVAPMIMLMPLTMQAMYPDQKLNFFIYATSAALFLVLFLFMRGQAFIGDKQFLRSMIPHHSGAILMCEKAKIQDPEIRTLCSEIIRGQRIEIEEMKRILERMK